MICTFRTALYRVFTLFNGEKPLDNAVNNVSLQLNF